MIDPTLAATFSAKPMRVLSPVPTAVPPAANMYRRGRVVSMRSMPGKGLLEIKRVINCEVEPQINHFD